MAEANGVATFDIAEFSTIEVERNIRRAQQDINRLELSIKYPTLFLPAYQPHKSPHRINGRWTERLEILHEALLIGEEVELKLWQHSKKLNEEELQRRRPKKNEEGERKETRFRYGKGEPRLYKSGRSI